MEILNGSERNKLQKNHIRKRGLWKNDSGCNNDVWKYLLLAY